MIRKLNKEIKNFFKIHTFRYRFPILWRFLSSTICSRNFSPGALLWIHRFTSCNAILTRMGQETGRTSSLRSSSSGIPFSPSKRKRERNTMRSSDVLECEISEYRNVSGNDPLPIPVYAIFYAIFQEKSQDFFRNDSNNTNIYTHLIN